MSPCRFKNANPIYKKNNYPTQAKGRVGCAPASAKMFSDTDNVPRPKPFCPRSVLEFGDLRNGLPPNFSSDHSDREPKPSPKSLEPIPERSPNDLGYIQVLADTNEVPAVGSKPLEVARYKHEQQSDGPPDLLIGPLPGQSRHPAIGGVFWTLLQLN